MIVQRLNFTVPLEELKSYYEILKNNYSHLDWSWENCGNDIVEQWRDAAYADPANLLTHGWAIQSNLTDISKPCPPWNISTLETVEYRNTELVFGVIVRLQTALPYAYRWSISVQPPGGKVTSHSDQEDEYTVWIPIYARGPSIVFDRDYELTADGSAYLLDTTVPHHTENNSNITRVTVIFRMNRRHKENILSLRGVV
jgi:hypothetical protein